MVGFYMVLVCFTINVRQKSLFITIVCGNRSGQMSKYQHYYIIDCFIINYLLCRSKFLETAIAVEHQHLDHAAVG